MIDQGYAAPTAKEVAERKEARLKMWTAVLGLLTAVFVLLTGFFAKKNDTAGTKIDTTQEQVRLLAGENAALRADNAKKEALIKQLEDTGTPSTTEPSASDTGTTAVFHKGPLVLKPAVSADLDAPDDDPQWRTDDVGVSDEDIRFSNNDAALSPGNSTAVMNQQDPTYATCRFATGYSRNESFSITKMKKAKTLCVITSQGRYSVLEIKSASNVEVAFEVTTYAKPSD